MAGSAGEKRISPKGPVMISVMEASIAYPVASLA
jgi:hypothetical protein